MSDDQRPGRVRLFSSAQPQARPSRRRGDLPKAGGDDGSASPMPMAAPGTIVGRRQRPSMLPMLLLFMLGSALGGMFVAALGLFKVPGL